jgi:hypothetical protein
LFVGVDVNAVPVDVGVPGPCPGALLDRITRGKWD